jgi:ABC-type antimicrobial peptide transport system permease subunit
MDSEYYILGECVSPETKTHQWLNLDWIFVRVENEGGAIAPYTQHKQLHYRTDNYIPTVYYRFGDLKHFGGTLVLSRDFSFSEIWRSHSVTVNH